MWVVLEASRQWRHGAGRVAGVRPAASLPAHHSSDHCRGAGADLRGRRVGLAAPLPACGLFCLARSPGFQELAPRFPSWKASAFLKLLLAKTSHVAPAARRPRVGTQKCELSLGGGCPRRRSCQPLACSLAASYFQLTQGSRRRDRCARLHQVSKSRLPPGRSEHIHTHARLQ